MSRTTECAYGHKQRVVGCVSCVIVFDWPAGDARPVSEPPAYVKEREIVALRQRIAWLEGMAMPHARRQENANGFQKGWHAALSRMSEVVDTAALAALVPFPAEDVDDTLPIPQAREATPPAAPHSIPQQDLPPDAAKILYDNLWHLITEDSQSVSAPAGPEPPDLRLLKLAAEAATRRHVRWAPGTKRFKESGHSGLAQIDCAHPDCVLVREASATPSPAREAGEDK